MEMMEMEDNPKLDLGSCRSDSTGLEEIMGIRKISVLDHMNGFQYTTEKSENFVIDMESFPHATNNKDINPNPRITLQRTLSRKGSLRSGSGCGGGGEKKSNSNLCPNDRDTTGATSSPRGLNVPEKASPLAVGTTADHSVNPQVHHHITITTATSNMNASTESRWAIRRNSFKRPSVSWTIDPKRVLFFFATLSSMGTMLLIYFTLSIGKLGSEDSSLD